MEMNECRDAFSQFDCGNFCVYNVQVVLFWQNFKYMLIDCVFACNSIHENEILIENLKIGTMKA